MIEKNWFKSLPIIRNISTKQSKHLSRCRLGITIVKLIVVRVHIHLKSWLNKIVQLPWNPIEFILAITLLFFEL